MGGLRQRGLRGVQLVISDEHLGLKKAIRERVPISGGFAEPMNTGGFTLPWLMIESMTEG